MRRPGFTLIEIVAALALTGLVLVGARLLLDQLADTRVRLEVQRARSDAGANAIQLLRSLAAHAERGDSAASFSGASGSARFDSWCLTPASWLERCRVSLQIETRGDSSSVIATIDAAQPLALATARSPATFIYLTRERRWSGEWTSKLSIPLALGLVDGDTLVLPLGSP